MQQTLEVLIHLDKGAEVGGLGDGSPDHRAHHVGLRNETDPGILFHLLEAQCNALALLVDFKDHRMNLFTLLDLLRGVNDLASP